MKSTDRLPDRKLFHIPCLAVWRHLAGLKQCELAATSGVDRGTIGRIESIPARHVHGVMVNRLADALSIPPVLLILQPGELRRRLESFRPASDNGKAA